MALRIVIFSRRTAPLIQQKVRCFSTAADDEEFRVLNLRPHKGRQFAERRKIKKPETLPPRFRQMSPEQDWGAVWPGPRTFHPATVPLPVRQGFTEGGKAPPGKFANAELMKIPNFLHLTPPVVRRQCEALKRFCTQWPRGLENEEKIERNFPLRVISTDYCLSSPSIRMPLARIVSLKLKLATLKLDEHARDKFLRLVKERYNPDTDELTIVTDRCPLRKQNYDYALYLLTALCHESRSVEVWEQAKSVADMEFYDWTRNRSAETSREIVNWNGGDAKPPQKYVTAVERLMNEGENSQNLQQYRNAVLELLNLKSSPSSETPEVK